MLSRLRKGEPSKSEKGFGLGLPHARQTLESWKGSLKLASNLGFGTQAQVKLPKASPAPWFVPTLELPKGAQVVVLDDDDTIHDTWRDRFKEFPKIMVHHFYDTLSFKQWWEDNETGGLRICLIDFELINEETTGLNIIKELGIEGISVLVTSRFDEEEIIVDCINLGVPLLPKEMAHHIPLQAIRIFSILITSV